jgi:aminoglycoside phosphotransferase (APT) family kinase protein
MQVVTMEDARGDRRNFVVRVYLPREALDTERARREFRTIELARSAGVPAPEPLFLDAEAAYFGTPAMLLSYLPGKPLYQPSTPASWCEGLVGAMLSIHAVTPDDHDLGWLPRFGREEIGAEIEALRDDIGALDDDLAREAVGVLRANLDRVEWLPPRLIHEDFWPGNTVWYRGRLVGVIDWANAKLGDPRIDLSQCCIDALLVNDFEVSDALQDTYVERSPTAVRDLWFIDLFQGLKALLYYEIWLIGYRDAGLTHITPERSRDRLRVFVRRSLDAAKN